MENNQNSRQTDHPEPINSGDLSKESDIKRVRKTALPLIISWAGHEYLAATSVMVLISLSKRIA